jgi:hypothetical protein
MKLWAIEELSKLTMVAAGFSDRTIPTNCPTKQNSSWPGLWKLQIQQNVPIYT